MAVQKLLDHEVSVPEAVVRVLEQAGIDHVFGMPGGGTGRIFNALYDHQQKIRAVLVREEGLGAVMADVYGRLTGKPGVVMGQAAFMLTNSGMGIVEGFLAGSPMLVLSDLSDNAPFSHHGPYQSGTGDYGSWDAKGTIGGYTKQVFVAREGAQAVQDTQLAIKHALAGHRGPVAVLYHSAALGATVGPETTPRLYDTAPYLAPSHDSARQTAPAAQVERVVRLLASAQRPIVVAGNGVRIAGARAELRALAEHLGTPVATTASGKGVFPETHPLALGVFGTFGLEAANAVVSEADLVLAVGSKLGPTDTAFENRALLDPERQTIIQIDVEPKHAAWTFPVAQAVLGDARAVLAQLLEAAKDAGVSDSGWGSRRVAEAHESLGSWDIEASRSDETPIDPRRLIRELHLALPDEAIVTCDAGENRLFMMHHFRTKGILEYLQPAAVGGMGYAVPAALAAKLVHPDRPAVAVCGDGGFGIALNGLFTAVEQRIPIVVVVFNNGHLGWVYHGQGDRHIASDFGAGFDYASIARAMGCASERVERPEALGVALDRAMQSERPIVLDVVTSLKPTFREVTSPLAAH
jgi:acetolactate synthase-1/2/3 large subunit